MKNLNKMKENRIYTFIIFLLVTIVIVYGAMRIMSWMNKQSEPLSQTELLITNDHSDTVTVYLTLNSGDDSWVTDVNGIFGITTNGLQGHFDLAPNDTLRYTPPKGKAIGGNFGFNVAPVNCPVGSTVCEFTLNNYDNPNQFAQEALDISCVAAVSFIAEYTMTGGGKWSANYKGYMDINNIRNNRKGLNVGNAGVFPVGCDSCIKPYIPPSCVSGIPIMPQKHNICNVQRDARYSGGQVVLAYKGLP